MHELVSGRGLNLGREGRSTVFAAPLPMPGANAFTSPSLIEPRGVVGFEVILGAYESLPSMAATGSVSLVS